MQIWKKGSKVGVWKKRQTKMISNLGGLSLRTFLCHRRNMRGTEKPIWVVFENIEIAELIRIGNLLFRRTLDTDYDSATSTLKAIIGSIPEMSVVTIRIPVYRKESGNMLDPIAMKTKLNLAVQLGE